MKKIKVYTKTGDNGTTGLFSGQRVPKHHVRIKAYGTIDELNSWVGLIRSEKINQEQAEELIKIQHDLMYIGSELANEGEQSSAFGIETIDEDAVSLLENWIDRMTEELPPLKNFVIPGASWSRFTCSMGCSKSGKRSSFAFGNCPNTDSVSSRETI